MASGGSRNRSGPSVDPKSGRSDARGLKFVSLPREGFTGKAPAYPFADTDFAYDSPTANRELEVWADLWRTPQASVWAVEPWRWRSVAQYVRLSVRLEDPAAPASLVAGVLRIGDQIGLSPAGLKENGWALAADEVKAKRESKPAASSQPAPTRRLRAVNGG